jgi:hypothetical protein
MRRDRHMYIIYDDEQSGFVCFRPGTGVHSKYQGLSDLTIPLHKNVKADYSHVYLERPFTALYIRNDLYKARKSLWQ